MKKTDIAFIFKELEKNFYSVETELDYSSPFQLLVAVILSAQCTDKRVNILSPALFQAFPSVEKMAISSQDKIFSYIKTCSYPNNKAKNLLWMAQTLLSEFGWIIPKDIKLLQKLPWVGLKTAKVVSYVLYDTPVIAVDTHVFRVVNRLGLLTTKNGDTIKDRDKMSELLEKEIPNKYKKIAHHSLIYFGRYHCTARNPKCDTCVFNTFCKYFSKLK